MGLAGDVRISKGDEMHRVKCDVDDDRRFDALRALVGDCVADACDHSEYRIQHSAAQMGGV